MAILPVSSLRNYNVKPLSLTNTHNTIAPQSDKQVTTKDIPYSYPIAFKGGKEDEGQIPPDNNLKGGGVNSSDINVDLPHSETQESDIDFTHADELEFPEITPVYTD